MKKKLVMFVLTILVVASFFGAGCAKKEDAKSESVTEESEVKELEDEGGKDLETLQGFLPDAKDYFASDDIKEDSYVNWEGDAVVSYFIYDSWSEEEYASYKEAVMAAGFEDVNYEYENHFAARTNDGNWYFSMGEDVEQGRNVLIINASRDHEGK